MVVNAVKEAYDKAMNLLRENQGKLHELAKYLYDRETITGDEFMEILNQRDLADTEIRNEDSENGNSGNTESGENTAAKLTIENE